MRSSARRLTAALACTLALAACGSQPSGDASARGDTSRTIPAPATGISDDFPLSAGMGGPEDAIPTSRTGTGLRSLELCGSSPLRGLGTRDRLVADNSGGEALNTRELVLLGSADAAADLAQSLADLSSECASTPLPDGWELTTEVRRSPFGEAPDAVLVQRYLLDGESMPGVRIVHVVHDGAALLVTWTYGEWDDVADGVRQTTEPLRQTVAAMAVFGEGAGSSPEPAPLALTPIPADFPLAVGLPEPDGETMVDVPSADGDGIGVVEMCGQEVWPLGGTAGGSRRLVTDAHGPEWLDARELVVHADAEVASNVMAALRQAARECRTNDHEVWTVLGRDTGYDTVTVGLTYDRGLGSSVFQVTRVGSARLMVQTYGEGSLASLDEQADGVTGTTEQILPAMCVFTKTGC